MSAREGLQSLIDDLEDKMRADLARERMERSEELARRPCTEPGCFQPPSHQFAYRNVCVSHYIECLRKAVRETKLRLEVEQDRLAIAERRLSSSEDAKSLRCLRCGGVFPKDGLSVIEAWHHAVRIEGETERWCGPLVPWEPE